MWRSGSPRPTSRSSPPTELRPGVDSTYTLVDVESPELVALLAGSPGRRAHRRRHVHRFRDPRLPRAGSPPRNPMTFRQFTGTRCFRSATGRATTSAGGTWTRAAQHRPPRAGGARAGRCRERRDHPERRPAAHQGRQSPGDRPARHVRPGGCLDCGHHARAALADCSSGEPRFRQSAQAVGGIAVAPDADAIVGDTASFSVVDCPGCGGMLKPDIVYFGENVPKNRVEQAYSLVDEADALLVAGSSLTVHVRAAVRPARRRAGNPDRDHQPGPHPRRRAGHREDRQRLLTHACPAG